METRTLGGTGLVVSRLGLGLAALGRPGYINLGHATDLHANYDVAAMQAHAEAVLDSARDAGIRYFDAARSYGQAEAFLAQWLTSRGIDPGAVVVGSKWGYTYTAGWRVTAEKHEIKDHSLAIVQRQATESRAVLGDHLNLYQIHSATLESGVLEDGAVLAELDRLKGTGLNADFRVASFRDNRRCSRSRIPSIVCISLGGLSPLSSSSALDSSLVPADAAFAPTPRGSSA
jgi:aryl-alcohol dehydrogenase-like predicted oxidoreductase